jgi:hypothetical protein
MAGVRTPSPKTNAAPRMTRTSKILRAFLLPSRNCETRLFLLKLYLLKLVKLMSDFIPDACTAAVGPMFAYWHSKEYTANVPPAQTWEIEVRLLNYSSDTRTTRRFRVIHKDR